MSDTRTDLERKLRMEIEFYTAQCRILSRDVAHLEDVYSTNRARFETIKNDYDESEELVRIMKLITG